MNNTKNLFGNSIIMIILLYYCINIVSATSPTTINIVLNWSDLPKTNTSILINFTSTLNASNTSIQYLNVTKSGISTNQTWVGGITLASLSTYGGLFNLNYSIPQNISSQNYTQIVISNNTDNSTTNLTFNFEIRNQSTSQSNGTFSYSGNCSYLNSLSNPVYYYTWNESQLPKNESKCFAISQEIGSTIYFYATSLMSYSGLTNYTFNSSQNYEFNATMQFPYRNINESSKSWTESIVITGSTSKIISYVVTITDPTYITIYNGTNQTTNVTQYINWTSLSNMTVDQFLSWVSTYNGTSPQYVVSVRNNTQYVSIPTSPEAFALWVSQFDPNKVSQLEKEIADVKLAFQEEQSDSEFAKQQVSVLETDKKTLIQDLKLKEDEMNKTITAIYKTQEKKRRQMWMWVGIGASVLLVGYGIYWWKLQEEIYGF